MKRKCYICKAEKELIGENFGKRPKDKLGFRRACKKCESEQQKEKYRNGYNAYYKNYHKVRYSNPRQRAIQLATSYRFIDKKKGLECSVNAEDIHEITLSPCVYCGESNQLKLGIDRIDNSVGHIKSNIVSCCDDCNVARSDHFTHEEMFVIGKSIKQVKEQRNNKLYIAAG